MASIAALAPLGVSDLQAQGLSHWELNVHAATLRENLFEETGNGMQAGVRLLRNTRSGLAIGGNVDVVRRSDVDLGPGIAAENPSLTMLLYSLGLDYVFPTRGRARFFLSAGFGAATTRLEGVSDPRVQESSTGQLIPMGAGLKIYNRPVDPSWAFRVDVRDNLIFVNTLTPGAENEELEPRHNLEFSAGFSFAFGGGPPQRGAPVRPVPPAAVVGDADRDGVPDARDGCEDTPPGSAVDDIGCPTALDTDGDGVPDRALPPRPTVDSDGDGVPDGPDRCPDTPRGVRIDALGCPVPEEPVPAPARPAPVRPAPARPVDSDADGVVDAVDRCANTPRGVRIDAVGCPVPEVAPARPAPRPAVVDTDGDGVADSDDRCVNTPRGVTVNANGCPIEVDTDGDGVSGAADRCPNTPAGVAVDASGCLAEAAAPDDEPLQPPAARQPAPDEPQDEAEDEPAEEPAAVPPAVTGACVDARPWFEANIPILFEGREWRKVGTPEPITPDNLRRVGEVDGVPVLVSAFARQPYGDVWLPLCVPAGSYQLYIP